MTTTPAAERWRSELAGWAIPEEIIARAPEPPWGFPPELWGHSHDANPDTTSRRRALEALERLPGGAGTVLDVGCGGGRASLTLHPHVTAVTGVDAHEGMLGSFDDAATSLRIEHRSVLGSWPAVAQGDAIELADVVVCHHVAYNVPDLGDFVTALAAHARERVVMEVTATHPMVATAPLWKQFHDLDRPSGPNAELAVAVLREIGIQPNVEMFTNPRHPVDRAVIVSFNRKRLCLPPDRDAEVDDALGDSPGKPRDMVTLWWDV
ncbi:MAG TPA: methyltransferase domain-containing protein [Acidimicrobiales bacterium]|nr:methyltransferase domain-containing protein [Acidimicrobiales bacterium]